MQVLAEAYLAMIDSLHVELTYGGCPPAYARRLEALTVVAGGGLR
ncbi:hypothetical protein AB6846_22285 [Serratia proteamaculans]